MVVPHVRNARRQRKVVNYNESTPEEDKVTKRKNVEAKTSAVVVAETSTAAESGEPAAKKSRATKVLKKPKETENETNDEPAEPAVKKGAKGAMANRRAKKAAPKKDLAVAVVVQPAISAENADPPAGTPAEKVMDFNFRITSWNVAGLRAIAKKGTLDFIVSNLPDIVCMQVSHILPRPVKGFYKWLRFFRRSNASKKSAR